MLLSWHIRYLDSRDRTFKDRALMLDTEELDAPTRAAVELFEEMQNIDSQRRWLKFRHLFHPDTLSPDDLNRMVERCGRVGSVFIHDYFEDEHGQSLSNQRMAEILAGSPDVIAISPGAQQHDIDYILADKRPIPIDEISLSAEDLRTLGYFWRDLRQLMASAFVKDGPGTLCSSGPAGPELRTALTDEEIGSFLMIFRRLYMTSELGCFVNAVNVFARVAHEYPLGTWMAGVGTEYQRELSQPPRLVPYVGTAGFKVERKLLIDVFLYTRYAHQPNPRRAKQYQQCLDAVGGRVGLLTWLFLGAVWEFSLHMKNAGRIIGDFFDRYCATHAVSSDILNSVAHDNPGIGVLEKKEHRNRRLLEQAAESLARQMWEADGSPEGGPARYVHSAREQLAKALAPGSSVPRLHERT